MSAAGSDSDAETVITEGMIERGKERTEKETQGKVPVSQITPFQFFDWMGEWVMAAQIFFVRAQAFCAVFNQLVRSSAQLLFLE